MKDPIERFEALKEITDFRNGIFHDENLRRDNKHDWEAAYTLGKLYDRVYRLPKAKEAIGYQKVVRAEGWAETLHLCSKCGKIVPFIDWCQPYCSGCGVRFRNYTKWQAKESRKRK